VNQHARRPLPVPRLLDPGQLEFQFEPFARIVKELVPLIEQASKEMKFFKDGEPLEPNWSRYFELANYGVLHILTARFDGLLVGILVMFCGPHMYSVSTLIAESKLIYLDKAFRTGWNGLKMFRVMEAGMEKLKVQHIILDGLEEFFNDNGRTLKVLFTRLGYKPRGFIYSKRL